MWLLLPAGAQWCGYHYTGSVDGLVDALLLDSSGELPNQNWSHPLEAQLFMYTQEFDLYHPLLPAEHILSFHFKTFAGKLLQFGRQLQ